MNIRIKPTKSENGEKDPEDQFLEKLAEVQENDVPTLPPMKPKPRETVNVQQLMETLLEAWTNPSVRMWVDGNELCFEQVDQSNKTKNTWRIGFSHVRTSQVRLIK